MHEQVHRWVQWGSQMDSIGMEDGRAVVVGCILSGVDAVCWPEAVPTLHPEVNGECVPTVGDDGGAPEDNDLKLFNHWEDKLGDEQHGESEASSVHKEVHRHREINTNRYTLRKRIKEPQQIQT